MNRKDVLEEALKLITGDRAESYGDAYENHARIAEGWNIIIKGAMMSHGLLTPAHVTLMMDWVKTSRLIESIDHVDSWIDKAGYTALGAELTGPRNEEIKLTGLQMAMFAPKSEWVPPLELPDLTQAKKIAIDVETKDPNLKSNGPGWPTGDGEVVGYAIATDDWAGYIPVRHFGGGNLDEKIVNRWLKKVFECPADKIMHNAQYDLGWIRQMGFTVNGRIIDTMVIASLLDENRFSYSLNALAYDHLNKTKSEKALVEAAKEFGIDPKAEMWKMPAMYVGPYAEADATLTLELWNYFSVQLGKEDLWDIANLELDLLPCLVDMTFRGVRVDQDRVERTRDMLLKREKEVMKEIKRLAGTDVEIWAAQSLSKAFDKLDITYPKTEKGAPSFTKLFLAEHEHPLAKLVVEARNLNKTSGTFINTIQKALSCRWPHTFAHKPDKIRRWRYGFGAHINVQSQSTANPCPRSRAWPYDPKPFPTRRRRPVGRH